MTSNWNIKSGTAASDSINFYPNDEYFGGGGDDNFLTGLAGQQGLVPDYSQDGVLLSGGSGNDYYALYGVNGVAIISDEGSSHNDTLSSVNISIKNSSVGIVNQNDLIIIDKSYGDYGILIHDWLSNKNKIENFRFSDAEYSLSALQSVIPTLPGYMGNITLQQIGYNDASEYTDGFLRVASFAANIERGNSSNDRIIGTSGSDGLLGGSGVDTIISGDGNDELYGGNGTADPSDSGDQLFSERGNDTVLGNSGNDLISGGKGIDELYGGNGNDTVFGGDNASDVNDDSDVIYGNAGTDHIFGNAGNDLIFGGNGYGDPSDSGDVIYGGRGNDTIYGNGGNDTIDAGTGNDLLYGGSGFDRFVFNPGFNSDTIAGFDNPGAAGGDTIVISSSLSQSVSNILNLISYSANTVTINFGNNNIITIQNISANSFTSDDFSLI